MQNRVFQCVAGGADRDNSFKGGLRAQARTAILPPYFPRIARPFRIKLQLAASTSEALRAS